MLRQLIRGKALFLIFIWGMGGSFQNGFHLAGMSSPSPFIQRFINSSWYERYEEPVLPQTSTLIWSATVSLYGVGGFFGAASVKCIVGKLGRKRAMIGYNFVNIAAAVIMLTSKGANSFEMVILARFLYGFAAGLGGTIHWLYLGESSPKNTRGIMTQSLLTFFSIGKVSGQLLGLSEILGHEELWNILLSVPVCFSVAQLLILPFFPETPRYLLIEKGDAEACKKALQSLWGQGEYNQEMEEMMAEQATIKGVCPKSPLELVRDKSVRWQIITMILALGCVQFSGVTVANIFSFDIFLNAGVPRDKIRYITLGVGLSEILASIFCGLLIERTGRRPLLWGSFGTMSVILVLITVTLNLKDSNYWVPYITVGLMTLFMIFCVGPEGVIVCLSNEIYLQHYRPAAGVIMGLQKWLDMAVSSQIFPFIIDALKSYCFVPFACVSLLGLLYGFFLLPETKGKTVLQISEEFKAITVCGKSFSVEESQETKL